MPTYVAFGKDFGRERMLGGPDFLELQRHTDVKKTSLVRRTAARSRLGLI